MPAHQQGSARRVKRDRQQDGQDGDFSHHEEWMARFGNCSRKPARKVWSQPTP